MSANDRESTSSKTGQSCQTEAVVLLNAISETTILKLFAQCLKWGPIVS